MSMIRVANVTFGYDTSSENVFENISFQADTSWKLGLIGRNGKGKTTLLHLLEGKYPYKGEIQTSMPFQYFPFHAGNQERNTIDVLEDMDPQYEFWKILREMNLLGIPEDVLFRPYETLSCGERTKIQLAVLFAGENSFSGETGIRERISGRKTENVSENLYPPFLLPAVQAELFNGRSEGRHDQSLAARRLADAVRCVTAGMEFLNRNIQS